ncbi:UNVERIFIED_CONTAM: hypothetical protein GTU68_042691 [Idotea baltica]|nr:hypothetical protein [Idotea baltica]
MASRSTIWRRLIA